MPRTAGMLGFKGQNKINEYIWKYKYFSSLEQCSGANLKCDKIT